MIRCVVISLRFGQQVAEFLRQKPEAGDEMVDSIITRIKDSKTIKLTKHQVVVVLGNLNKEVPTSGGFWQKRTIACDQYYLMVGNDRKVGLSMDRGIRRIVDKATLACLARFYAWETSF